MNKSDDHDLVEAACNGDRSAVEALVSRYQKTVFNIVYRMLHDREAARDVTQTVFLKTFENLHSYDPERKFFSWICRIAINEAINCQTHSKPHTDFDEGRIPGHDNPGDELQQNELQLGLEAALMKLSTEQRSVIVFRHIAGMSYHDISLTLGISENTVKSRLFSARQKMREIMKKEAYL